MPERVYEPEESVFAAMLVPTITMSAFDIGLPVEASVTIPVTVVLVRTGDKNMVCMSVVDPLMTIQYF